MIIPYGSLFIGLSDEQSDDDTKEITLDVFKNKLWKSYHGAHIYDVMNCIDEHEMKSYVLENYPIEKYYQAFVSQLGLKRMEKPKRKVLFLRSYEVYKRKTFKLPQDVLDNLKRLKREEWTTEDYQYFEKASEEMKKYIIPKNQFFDELKVLEEKAK